ncbi:DUF2637 domain-containing protein [Streptomyces virginiae]|uniref:DUF2637 domain-containing protein n=1 Tax=Streptomyces virginiae TaxID=1961 RepID=UPI00332D7AA5
MRHHLRRLRAVDPILIQAVIAAAISFSHIHDIAEAAGQGGWKAWGYPVSVDLLLVMAWKMIRAARTEGRNALGPWVWFVLSLAASLGANVATAGVMDLSAPPAWLRTVVAGWPVLAFFGGSLLFHSRSRKSAPEVVQEEPQLPAEEPREGLPEEEPTSALEEPHRPILRTYAEVAVALGVKDVTVRGWANQGHVRKYTGPEAGTVRVDLSECTARHHKTRRTVGV